MKKIWVHVSKNFTDSNRFDREYYFQMSPQERLKIMQQLREMYYKFPLSINRKIKNGRRKRLQRVIRVVEKT